VAVKSHLRQGRDYENLITGITISVFEMRDMKPYFIKWISIDVETQITHKEKNPIMVLVQISATLTCP
jgi:hypothetical protein